MFPRVADVPCLTTGQMIEVDRAMTEDLHIDLLQMMENAGRHLAHLARERFLGGSPDGKVVVVLAGSGGNGGGAMAAARRLHTWGADVMVVVTADRPALAPVTARQREILERMRVPIRPVSGLASARDVALVIDGILGYSLSGAPHGVPGEAIQWANRRTAPVLSLDVPSGIDATSGTVLAPAIRATATMTLALPKAGLRVLQAAPSVGELYLADIGVPSDLYASALRIPVGFLFARSEILRVV